MQEADHTVEKISINLAQDQEQDIPGLLLESVGSDLLHMKIITSHIQMIKKQSIGKSISINLSTAEQ